jgi:hypothetical protein
VLQAEAKAVMVESEVAVELLVLGLQSVLVK